MNKSRSSNKLFEIAVNMKNALLTFLPQEQFQCHSAYKCQNNKLVRRSMYTVSNKKEITNL